MRKWAVYYTTFGSSVTRVITEAETAELAVARVKGWFTAKGFEGRAERW